jgi:hypothetical protein
LKALMRDYERARKRTPKRTSKARKWKSGFEAQFALFPIRWIKRLREAGVGGSTYHLALVILIENFKVEHFATKEIVRSHQA